MSLPPDSTTPPAGRDGAHAAHGAHSARSAHGVPPGGLAGVDDGFRPLDYRAADYFPAPRPPRRRRRGRGPAALLALLLGLGVWWTRADDPRGDVETLADPRTYSDLVDRARSVLDDVTAETEEIARGPMPVTGEALGGTRGTPPIGLEESVSRLAAPVEVSRPSEAYGFAAVQDDGVTPVAWSPCRPIHYVINADGAPEGFERGVDAAIAELSAATGLVFIDGGHTDEVPDARRPAYLPDRYGDRWAPVIIAVADPGQVAFLEGDTAGVAYTYRVRGLRSGTWHLVSGSVFIDHGAFAFHADAVDDPGWLTVLRHELGHLVGLDHLDDPSQLMNPVTSTAVHRYQDGDLTGLAALGGGDCAPDV